jgi:two-component SAPR family response regulator
MFLEKTGEIYIIASFQSATKVLNEIKKLKPDVVFLDIEMPEMTGIELASNIVLINCDIEIVFVTAYNQYALEAFKVNAVDYLLKPILQKDINKTVKRLMKICGKSPIVRKDELGARIQCESDLHKIVYYF